MLKDRVIEQRAINESRASKQEENMNGLRMHLGRLVEDADREDDRIRTMHAELIRLLGAVERLFLSVRCDRSPVYKILGKCSSRHKFVRQSPGLMDGDNRTNGSETTYSIDKFECFDEILRDNKSFRISRRHSRLKFRVETFRF